MTNPTPQPFVAGASLDDLTTLSKNPLLSRLGAREMSVLWELFDQVAVVSDTAMQREGETGDYAFFVLQGKARVERRRVLLKTLEPGDHFGELAIIGVRRRPTTVVSLSTMRLARLSRARFGRADRAEH